MDTIGWVGDAESGCLWVLDQTRLPEEVVQLDLNSPHELVEAIQRLVIRGAPALGVAGAYGVVLAMRLPEGPVRAGAIAELRAARPTAVNLARMVDRVAALAREGPARVLQGAHEIRWEEVRASSGMGSRGADLARSLVARPMIRALTICNTGGLAAVRRGTALAVVQTLHERGLLEDVIAAETRPLLQGARLTVWELQQMGAPHHLVVDAAAPYLISRGQVDVVLAGADRIAVNGDVANKIGTFSLALAAQHAGVPFIVVAPESTLDPATPDGTAIEIEDRDPSEVQHVRGHLVTLSGTPAYNPAFDVTPASLVTAIVTDKRVIRPNV